MPCVNITLAKRGVTLEQKKHIISEITKLLVDTLGVRPQATLIFLQEVETDSCGLEGITLTEFRKRQAQ